MQSVAWLAALVSLQRSRQPQHWLVLATAHLQPIALALVVLPKAIAGAVHREDIPLAVALGLEVAFVVAGDWQYAAQHALSHVDALQQPLLQGEHLLCSCCIVSGISQLCHAPCQCLVAHTTAVTETLPTQKSAL